MARFPDDEDALPPLAEVVASLVPVFGDEANEVNEDHEAELLPPVAVAPLRLEQITLAFPLELEAHTAAGRLVALGASPPTQYTETTIMPVFHHLRLTIGVDDGSSS